MQQKNKKTVYLSKIIGSVLKELREKVPNRSINKVAHEYGLDVGNTSRVENGLIEVKVVTLWKLAEAYEIPLSKLIKLVENKLPKDFHFFED